MRDRSPFRWLAGFLWMLTVVVASMILRSMLLTDDPLTFEYLRFSRTGALTTATVEKSLAGFVTYSYSTPDGVRHTGETEVRSLTAGDDLRVFYLPAAPDRSVRWREGFELLQLCFAVTFALACLMSLVDRLRRRG